MQGLQVVQPGLEVVDVTPKTNRYLRSNGLDGATVHSVHRNRHLQQRHPFGLSSLTFGLIVGIITAIVVGGAFAGGLYVVLARCRNDSLQLVHYHKPCNFVTDRI
jgi:hypothetical protein